MLKKELKTSSGLASPVEPCLCEDNCIDEAKVKAAKDRMKPDSTIQSLSETFKVLGDPTRTKILWVLSEEELCVCELAMLVDSSESAASHHLRILRNLKLVKYRRQGKATYYSLDDDHIKNLFREGLKHVQEK